MNSPDDVTGPVNIGNPVEISVKQLAEIILQMTKLPAEIVYHELPADDPKQRQPDITRARELLGWKPRVPLDQGLGRTIDYFRELLAEKMPASTEARARAS